MQSNLNACPTRPTERYAAAEDRFVTDTEAASLLSLSRDYLRALRVRGGGPTYSTLGRAVRYRVSVVMAWADAKSVATTSQYTKVN